MNTKTFLGNAVLQNFTLASFSAEGHPGVYLRAQGAEAREAQTEHRETLNTPEEHFLVDTDAEKKKAIKPFNALFEEDGKKKIKEVYVPFEQLKNIPALSGKKSAEVPGLRDRTNIRFHRMEDGTFQTVINTYDKEYDDLKKKDREKPARFVLRLNNEGQLGIEDSGGRVSATEKVDLIGADEAISSDKISFVSFRATGTPALSIRALEEAVETYGTQSETIRTMTTAARKIEGKRTAQETKALMEDLEQIRDSFLNTEAQDPGFRKGLLEWFRGFLREQQTNSVYVKPSDHMPKALKSLVAREGAILTFATPGEKAAFLNAAKNDKASIVPEAGVKGVQRYKFISGTETIRFTVHPGTNVTDLRNYREELGGAIERKFREFALAQTDTQSFGKLGSDDKTNLLNHFLDGSLQTLVDQEFEHEPETYTKDMAKFEVGTSLKSKLDLTKEYDSEEDGKKTVLSLKGQILSDLDANVDGRTLSQDANIDEARKKDIKKDARAFLEEEVNLAGMVSFESKTIQLPPEVVKVDLREYVKDSDNLSRDPKIKVDSNFLKVEAGSAKRINDAIRAKYGDVLTTARDELKKAAGKDKDRLAVVTQLDAFLKAKSTTNLVPLLNVHAFQDAVYVNGDARQGVKIDALKDKAQDVRDLMEVLMAADARLNRSKADQAPNDKTFDVLMAHKDNKNAFDQKYTKKFNEHFGVTGVFTEKLTKESLKDDIGTAKVDYIAVLRQEGVGDKNIYVEDHFHPDSLRAIAPEQLMGRKFENEQAVSLAMPYLRRVLGPLLTNAGDVDKALAAIKKGANGRTELEGLLKEDDANKKSLLAGLLTNHANYEASISIYPPCENPMVLVSLRGSGQIEIPKSKTVFVPKLGELPPEPGLEKIKLPELGYELPRDRIHEQRFVKRRGWRASLAEAFIPGIERLQSPLKRDPFYQNGLDVLEFKKDGVKQSTFSDKELSEKEMKRVRETFIVPTANGEYEMHIRGRVPVVSEADWNAASANGKKVGEFLKEKHSGGLDDLQKEIKRFKKTLGAGQWETLSGQALTAVALRQPEGDDTVATITLDRDENGTRVTQMSKEALGAGDVHTFNNLFQKLFDNIGVKRMKDKQIVELQRLGVIPGSWTVEQVKAMTGQAARLTEEEFRNYSQLAKELAEGNIAVASTKVFERGPNRWVLYAILAAAAGIVSSICVEEVKITIRIGFKLGSGVLV